MTKSELIENVAGNVGNLSKKDIEIIVSMIFDSMTESLVKGERIEVRGFGSFKIKERVARRGRNPKSGVSIDIPGKKMPFFKVGKELKEKVDSKTIT